MFRRYIHFDRRSDSLLVASLVDDCHAFELAIEHSNTHLLGIKGLWQRHPHTSCDGAQHAMQQLAGVPLSSNVFQLRNEANSQLYCTHMFDLVSLAIVHIQQKRDNRLYRIDVHDSPYFPQSIEIWMDKHLILSAKVDATHFVQPNYLEGAPTRKGFYQWAREHLNKEQQELGLIAQMALFVSYSRHFDLNAMKGAPAIDVGPKLGSCFALQPERADNSVRLASYRDIKDLELQVLKWHSG